jgi:hypothetical protein
VTYRLEHRALLCAIVCVIAAALLAPSVASAASSSNGGATYVPPPPPAKRAKIVSGQAVPPIAAPPAVKKAIAAANAITAKPYIYGGGHKPFSSRLDRGYDCSGSVSYALYGGRFLRSPLPSGALMDWAEDGPGQWITVYAHASHAYIVVAGLRFDTSMHDRDAPGPRTGPRWSRTLRKSKAFVARHPSGY